MNETRRYILIAMALCCAAAGGEQEQQQVNVSVKVVEFQTNHLLETGLSAYFKHRERPQPYGRVASRNGTLESADFTFPITDSAITVILDRISTSYGDMELALQALQTQGRASILSRPKAMVQVGQETPTIIETTRDIPYEDTVVVGATAARVTNFRPTGVSLSVLANQIVDDDGDPHTTDDTYIQLSLTAMVSEKGSPVSVALDEIIGGETIEVPEFISRSVTTTVWVRHGEVLILGGLYLKKKSKDLSTLPWLAQGEDFANNLVQRAIPFALPQVPVAATMGKQNTQEVRRELAFLIKAEMWRPAFTVADDFGFIEEEQESRKRKSPTDLITGVIGGIADIPQGIVQGITGGTDGGVSSSLGADKK